jgi:hypothetical protein
MAADPIFATTPNIDSGQVSATADTSLTATTTYTTVFTAGASGSKIEEIVFQGVGSTLAGVVRIFIYNGSTVRLLWEEAVTVVSSSTTAATYRTSRQFDNLVLEAGWTLRVTSAVANQLIAVHVFGADF